LTVKKQFIKALSLTSSVNEWLADSRQPRILHIFDRACNLINERREVLSIVTPQIGNGPFNLVLEEDILFSEYLAIECSVSIPGNQLLVGDLLIQTVNAKAWPPRPDWEKLHAHQDLILNQATQFPIVNYQPSLPISLLSTFSTSIAIADLPPAFAVARRLAGLGIGLTPAGDDFILGAVLAAWIIHPTEIAAVLVEGVANNAAPLTTSLSAAWLRSAGRGEAGILWHHFLNALVAGDPFQLQNSLSNILGMGETSGADAIAGFLGTVMGWVATTSKAL
jgi:uncharacterized protein DUF2877